ncbi:transmembrane protein 68 [Diaphorina citri]|uniref:Transmembrane protein 68 n=1 Tax=Diaphorina citri TaxID=121845 RepID=A0A1S3DIN1_DIACI|nr:transmembrane protein 68 [Diaphorina citri]XP_026686586.1 transmembrane protein 68 [Diaphorina citri]KAI5726689.1 hypothetical protein M8J76_006879 [Diaphorina citri]KAI5732206.1 hypothetical protein M8J77_023322 [Diaphorina citri]
MFYIDGLLSRFLRYFLGNYIDIDFTLWVSWLLTPLFITIFLPLIILSMVYLSAIMLYMYRFGQWQRLKEILTEEFTFWHRARTVIATMWDAHGWVWHGYEVVNMDRIPDNSSALIIYYHGALPVDLYYFLSKVFLVKNRLMHTVADNFLFRIPGLRILGEGLRVIPGTVKQCSDILQDNNIMAISPGGLYEAQLGDSYYKLMWRRRMGFAKVAIEAKVPIIPIFTRNIRESFRTVGWLKSFWNKLYIYTRLPLVPIYGGFPVKLVTYVGEPIPYDPNLTPEELAKKVAYAVEDLIKTHQKTPGSILRGLLERLPQNRRHYAYPWKSY